jgi:hypothetical protein
VAQVSDIAAAYLATVEGTSLAEGRRLIALGEYSAHDGDCVNRPYTCPVCARETALREAGDLQVRLAEAGYDIVARPQWTANDMTVAHAKAAARHSEIKWE